MIEITPEIFDKVNWNIKTITDSCIICTCTNKSTYYTLLMFTIMPENITYYSIASYCKRHKRRNKKNKNGLIEEYQELTTKEIFYARLHALH